MTHFHAQAALIRARIGVEGDDAPVDVLAVAQAYGVKVMYTDQLDVADFSGHLRFVNGAPVAVLNARQTPERMNVTLLEELCHLHYRHPPSTLSAQGREHDSVVEQEAYQTAAAVLLPAVVVARTVYRQASVAEVAALYGASVELFEMRIKVLGLWEPYRKARAA